MLVGLGLLLLSGTLAALIVRWLAGRRHGVAHAAGLLLGVTMAGFCAFVVFALVADNIGAQLRPAGALAVACFAAIGLAAAAAAAGGTRARRRALAGLRRAG